MTKVYSKALDQSIEVGRIIGKINGSKSGPTIIFTAGIHGNEPSGVFALERVIRELKEKDVSITGNVLAISGNLWALERGMRYEKQDLNRLWKGGKMRQLEYGELVAENEDMRQQIDIYETLKNVMDEHEGPYYFMDLHTTSSETIPFLTVNDSILNRQFTKQYPVPIILGIEEYLDGPLLSYVNKLGYVAFGYEGGQHDDLAAIENHVAFIYLTLAFAGVVEHYQVDFQHYYEVLAKNSIDTRHFYEIFYRHGIKEDEEFVMKPGFVNFQPIQKGEELATCNGETLCSTSNSRIFMPLYQSQGSDGYFMIRKVSPWMLRLSKVVRKWKLDRLMALLPGVKWATKDKTALYVNRRIARLFTKQIFHMLGYRSRELNESKYYMRNREATSRKSEYVNAPWYK